MSIDLHPTVQLHRQKPASRPSPLSALQLKQLALTAGADDAGLVPVGAAELADQHAELQALLPGARTLVSFVVRMNRESIRTPARSVSNLEFHRAGDETNEVARRLCRLLSDLGHRAVNPAMGFPMEMARFPGKLWTVSHKPVAVAAGLGVMGLHRNVIHPRFGNFILLGTVVTDAELDTRDRPLDFNPCLDCKLCVAACPVGAIAPDGHFDFSACYTHNYREFMGGFTDWVEQVADASNAREYRQRVTDAESTSIWQSLSYGANYKAAYCMAVCPAGEDVIGPFLDSRKDFVGAVLRPLQAKSEDVYVIAGSDAEAHVERRFKHKRKRVVRNTLRAATIADFAGGLPLRFQRQQAKGVSACYHFSFRGAEPQQLTVTVADQRVIIEPGLSGAADLTIVADSKTWLGFLAGERSLLWALLTRRIRVRGPLRLLKTFGRCFG